jgi:large subunit ribosomal protein L23Ae
LLLTPLLSIRFAFRFFASSIEPESFSSPNAAPVKAATAKAKAAAANVKKGVVRAKAKIRTSVHFHRPSTLKPARQPKYQRRAVPTKDARLDHHSVIK